MVETVRTRFDAFSFIAETPRLARASNSIAMQSLPSVMITRPVVPNRAPTLVVVFERFDRFSD